MFHLWSLAEQDLLSETVPYRLRDTGQGLNRVQAAPKTSRMMHAILNRAQKSLGGWVGSSVIHMGDHNVPNALMFIGKRFPSQRREHPLTGRQCRQVLADLPHPSPYLHHALAAADAVRLARAARVHRRGVWLARRAVPRDPRRLLPARVRRERRGQFLRCGELHRRTPHERVALVLVAREEAVFPRVPAYRCVPTFPAARLVPLLTFVVVVT